MQTTARLCFFSIEILLFFSAFISISQKFFSKGSNRALGLFRSFLFVINQKKTHTFLQPWLNLEHP